MFLSPEFSVMFWPATAYRRLAESAPDREGIVLALRRPAFVALFIGTIVSMTATERVTVPTLVSVSAYWSFATVLQAAGAWALIRASPQRIVSGARAVDLFFMAQGPWALWLLGIAAVSAVTTSTPTIPRIGLVTAPIVIAWTGVILFAFCRTILCATPREALTRTFLYQAGIWLFTGAYVSTAVQIWPRVLGALGW
jgi:hypothetical protein